MFAAALMTISSQLPAVLPQTVTANTVNDIGDHSVLFDTSLSDDDKRRILNLLRQAEVSSRSLSDFLRMSFWSAVQRLRADDPVQLADPFDPDVHRIDLEESRQWWKSNFTEYGCYCWPDGEQRISGFGDTVDDLDRGCFELYQCYKCVNKQPGCERVNWVSSHYGCKFVKDVNGLIDLDCSDANECLQALCECDKKFAKNVFNFLLTRDDKYTKAGGFNFTAECIKGPQHEEKACCGDWPNTKIFSKQISCCNDQLKVRDLGDGMGYQCDNSSITPTFDDLFQTITLNKNDPNLGPPVVHFDEHCEDGHCAPNEHCVDGHC